MIAVMISQHCYDATWRLFINQSINQIIFISESLDVVGFTAILQDGLVSVQRVRGAECDRSLIIGVGDVE